MKFSTVLNLTCVVTLFLLCACGDSNPLIGKWQGEVKSGDALVNEAMKGQMGNSERSLTFTGSEMIIATGSVEKREKVTYKKNSENSWSISNDNGKTWVQFELKDSDTLVQDLGMMGMKLILKRVK
jgi:hypothetical protein